MEAMTQTQRFQCRSFFIVKKVRGFMGLGMFPAGPFETGNHCWCVSMAKSTHH